MLLTLNDAVNVETIIYVGRKENLEQSKINEMLHDSNIKNLHIANAGPIPPNPAELIGTKRMANLMAKIRREFDYVIIDTPPIAIVTDALLLKNQSDLYIFVIRHGYSTKNVLQLIRMRYNNRVLMHAIDVIINELYMVDDTFEHKFNLINKLYYVKYLLYIRKPRYQVYTAVVRILYEIEGLISQM